MKKFKIKGTCITKKEIEFLAETGLKYCPACKLTLEFSEFAFEKRRGRLACRCIKCDRERQKVQNRIEAVKAKELKDSIFYTEGIIQKKINDHLSGLCEFKLAHLFMHELERKLLQASGLKYCGHCKKAHFLSEFKTGYNTSDGLSIYCVKYKPAKKKKCDEIIVNDDDDLRDFLIKTDPHHKLNIAKAAEYHRQNKYKFAASYNNRLRNAGI